MHRGDSAQFGEGGSGAFFLAKMCSDYEPIGNLFDKLSRKLADRALIVSDGSNCRISGVRKWRCEESGLDAFTEAQSQDFEQWGWNWKCVGYLGDPYGPTLVWGLTRLEK
jgi:hypothetical protein